MDDAFIIQVLEESEDGTIIAGIGHDLSRHLSTYRRVFIIPGMTPVGEQPEPVGYVVEECLN